MTDVTHKGTSWGSRWSGPSPAPLVGMVPDAVGAGCVAAAIAESILVRREIHHAWTRRNYSLYPRVGGTVPGVLRRRGGPGVGHADGVTSSHGDVPPPGVAAEESLPVQ